MNNFHVPGRFTWLMVLVFTAVVAVCLLAQSPAPPLFRAVTSDNLPSARAIIASDPGQVQARYHGRTCLHFAVVKKNADFLRWLVEVGADVNATDDEGNTPLHLAVYSRQDSPLIWLLVLGTNANARNHQGMTPLHVGAYMGMTNFALKHLLLHGADVSLTDASGHTFLDLTQRTQPALYKTYQELHTSQSN
jgi:ankyrin repeat protein